MGVMDNSMHLGAIPARFETWPLVRCADLSTLLNLLGPQFLHQCLTLSGIRKRRVNIGKEGAWRRIILYRGELSL